MSDSAIRSQAPFNVQRKVTTATSASDNPMAKKFSNKKFSNRLKKDTAQKGSIRLNAKLPTEQSPKHSLALVDTLQVRMPAPSDTSVHESSSLSSLENISNDDLGDHEARNWTPRNKERNIEIHAENIVDPPNTSHNINDIEQRQVRQFVEKLKRAVSAHSIKEDDKQLVTKHDSQSETRRSSDQALNITNLTSIWDEPKPFPSDLSDSGSEEHPFETPSFSAFRRPQLSNRQSSDADINATWVKDKDNAPIGWLSRHQKGHFANTDFACPVPAKYIPRIKQDLYEMVSNVSIETNEEAKSIPCEETVTESPPDANCCIIPSSTIADVTSPSLTGVSSLTNNETYDPAIVNIIPDADANSTVPSPSLSNDERSEITDGSSDIDVFNEPSVHSTSALLENIPYDELMFGEKDSMVDTNLDATPENMLQSQQARPRTHVFQKHTYSFSHDMSIATDNCNKGSTMVQEKLTQTSSAAVSFNQPYPHIDIDPIKQVFQKMVTVHDQHGHHDDRRTQAAHITLRGEANDGMVVRKEDEQDISLGVIVEHLARLRPYEEWSNIRYLDLSHQNLSAISGLRDCVPLLEVLNISHNIITHIDKLPRSLRQLKAHHNRITDCSGLCDLHDLHYLNISQNMLENLQELSTLRNMQELHAENNLISSWSGVKHMKLLVRLNLSHNRLRDLNLSGSSLHSLEMLNLAFNGIERLENLEHLTSLRAINLDHNEIKWMNIYQTLPSLELLRLSFNRLKIMDASPFPSVKTLYLDDNQLMTVRNLSVMVHLDSFSMRDQGGHKIDMDISQLRRVRKLFLSGNALPNLQEFQNFTNLEYLELCSTQLENLPNDFSLHFPNLVILYLSGNYLGDIAPLAGCSQLQKLVLVDNRLDNLKTMNQTLKQLHSLSYLDLRHNNLTSKFYATLSNPTGPSEDLISHYLSYEHDGRWSDNDHVFHRCMPQLWRNKREEYRATILKVCKRIKSLDGIKFEKIECIQAQQLLRRKIKDRA
ncbi:hypothetical protein K450DRAFT_253253 [Umbelopsis ramanniana AG]|uniref:Septation initiation network scaffold protein cdc11 n=1 Tax=Umbelopsis ramanniana AG TaxID=1314678 RepID=A0AAD5E5N2_UMBRA|nr:uncharacterized protein K450DRAFT_253253 [Umbelopsis ramanniana AG]KAI8577182.1 hypothetical protein K450DRAFT_253253 [Umbelopsis ramanniana AG]